MVDLLLANEAPIEAKPWLLWVWVYMQTPRPDGLSSSDEAAKLYTIEDALVDQLGRDNRALLCGRITTERRREFYFYGEGRDGFEESVRRVMADFAGYEFRLDSQEDRLWTQFLDVLCPGPENLERIQNGDVLDVMKREGDNHAIPREVMHWAYFPTQESRSSFRKAASDTGFMVDSEYEVEGDHRFCICVHRTQPIEQREIDETTIQLLHLAERFEGDYTGWEAQVTT